MTSPQQLRLRGTVSGEVEITGDVGGAGIRNTVVSADLKVARGAEQQPVGLRPPHSDLPVDGELRFKWLENGNSVQIEPSFVVVNETHLNFSGTLGENLQVGLLSHDLTDFLPLVDIAGGEAPATLPVSIRNGQARFDGSVTGPLTNPRVNGRVSLRNALVRNFEVDSVTADVHLTESLFDAPGILIQKDETRVAGDVRLTLEHWRNTPNSQIAADLQIRAAPIGELLSEGGAEADVDGLLGGTVRIRGNLGAPQISADLNAQNVRFSGEHFDQASLHFDLDSSRPQRVAGVLNLDLTRFDFSGSYNHPERDFRTGILNFSVEGKGYPIDTLSSVRELDATLSGYASVSLEGAIRIDHDTVLPQRLDGQIVLDHAKIHGRSLDRLEVSATTRNHTITLSTNVALGHTAARGTAEILLERNYPTSCHLSFSGVQLEELIDLASNKSSSEAATDKKADSQVAETPTFAGSFNAEVDYAFPLRHFGQGSGRLTVTDLVMRPRQSALPASSNASEIRLTNNGPLVMDVTTKSVRIRQARFSGTDTDLEVSGAYVVGSKTPWDLKLAGQANLAVLSSVRPDLLAGGSSTINATLRGALESPQLSGQMDLKNASFYLAESPVGIDQVNGAIRFSQNRAVVEKLTGKSGGGDIELSGFIGFSGNRAVYHLLSKATNVRVRYPPGFSTTMDASLNLTGTRERSLLAGTVTLVRSSFSSEGDASSLLKQSSGPVTVPVSGNAFLQGLQFDVRVNARPETSVHHEPGARCVVERRSASPGQPVQADSAGPHFGGAGRN